MEKTRVSVHDNISTDKVETHVVSCGECLAFLISLLSEIVHGKHADDTR